MPSPIKIRVSGEFACFTRPEMKVERVSYEVITPSAARGILEAIYWKPQVRWVVERLHVLKSIRLTSIRRNEVAAKIPTGGKAGVAAAMKTAQGRLGMYIEEERQQRAALVLRDVAYVIEARFDLLDETDPIEKHYAMFRRRAEGGQCFHRPYLGCREFPADFVWVDGEIPVTQLPDDQRDRNFGYMLHDIDYDADMTPHFFHAQMHGGVIVVPPFNSSEVRS